MQLWKLRPAGRLPGSTHLATANHSPEGQEPSQWLPSPSVANQRRGHYRPDAARQGQPSEAFRTRGRPADSPTAQNRTQGQARIMDSGRAGRPGATEAAPSIPPPFAYVAPSLFLGNARAAAAPELLARAGVTLCVNVSRQQPGPRAPGVAELRVPVFDDPAEDLLAHLEPTCAAIEAAVRAGGACLVYCKNGRSRSAAVCTAYLMRHRGLSLAQAFQTVKSARPVAEPNPGFWSQLQKYEEALRSRSRSRLPGEPSGL